MEIPLNLLTLVHMVAIVLGIMSAAIILFYGFKTYPANQPLGIGQLSISLGIFISFCAVSKLILLWPFVYRVGHIFALIFVPMPLLHAVFYTRKRSWKWFDMLHAIPVLIYLVDFWDVLVLPAADKLALIQLEINDLDLMGQFRQSKYFGPNFHQEFRTILFSAYWVAQVVVMVRWLRSQSALTSDAKVWRNWMMVFLGCQFFMWFPFYLRLLGMNILTTYQIVNSLSVVWLTVSSIFIFFYPAILYGPKRKEQNSVSNLTNVPAKAPITDGELHKLKDALNTIDCELEEKKFFLIQGYSINDFSKDIQLPVYLISKSINHFRGVSFIDYINQKRIQFCILKFDNGEWLTYTVEAIAFECGFNSRNSFTNAFKKIQGTLPSDYRQTKLSDQSSL